MSNETYVKRQLMSIAELKTGDVVQGKSSGLSYVVTDNYGDHAIAVRTMHVSNPSEWLLVEADADDD